MELYQQVDLHRVNTIEVRTNVRRASFLYVFEVELQRSSLIVC